MAVVKIPAEPGQTPHDDGHTEAIPHQLDVCDQGGGQLTHAAGQLGGRGGQGPLDVFQLQFTLLNIIIIQQYSLK